MHKLENNYFKYRFNDNLSIYLLSIFPIISFLGNAIINVYLIIVCICFARMIIKFKINFINNIFFKILIFFWFSLLINLLFSQNFESSFSRSLGFARFIPFVFFVALILNQNKNSLKKILKFWSVIFLIVSADLILEKIIGKNSLGFHTTSNARLAGFMGDELKIGHYYYYFYLIVLVTVHNFYSKKLYHLLLFGTCFLIISFLIGERANFFKCLFLFIFFFLFLYKKKIKQILLTLFTIAILIAIFINNNNLYKERFFNKIFLKIYNQGFISYYKETHYAAHAFTAIEIFKNNKIFGVGLKNFRNESGKKKYENIDVKEVKKRWSTHPHQFHYEFLSETGLFGYFCWLFFLITTIYFSTRRYLENKKNILLLSSLLIFITNIFPVIPTGSFFTTYGAALFWMNYGMLVSQSINNENKVT